MPRGGFGNATDFAGFRPTQTPTIHFESSTRTFFSSPNAVWAGKRLKRTDPIRGEPKPAATPWWFWSSMRARNDVVQDARAVTSIEQLVRAGLVRRIRPRRPPIGPARLVELDIAGGFQGSAEDDDFRFRV